MECGGIVCKSQIVGYANQPWEDDPRSLLSWWDMEKFSAHIFFAISIVLEKLRHYAVDEDRVLKKDGVIPSEWLPDLNVKCQEIGLRYSSKYITRTIEQIRKGETTIAEWKEMIPEIQNRIMDEMEDNLFMYIPSARAGRYDLAEPFGAQVAKDFPSCSFDAKEAGNCFASGRYTASVFHLMRVLEVGLIAFANLFPSVPTNKENWQQIIEKIESEIRDMPKVVVKTPDWKEKQEKYSQLANNFMFFKDAWRNYTAHARGKYTEDESDAIYRNVRSFMQGLVAQGILE
jgi:hypothetical protein